MQDRERPYDKFFKVYLLGLFTASKVAEARARLREDVNAEAFVSRSLT
jgi:hypothetical protein